jgi:uracil-DNA glycosylase family 4
MPTLDLLAADIHACARCPRLASFLADCREARPDYWGRPVSGFGDPSARLFILGLAPGYHGANRHGRVFTGDDSGRWLYGALHELGVCSERESTGREQPLRLEGVWISNAIRCVPPQNRPLPAEMDACRPFLEQELSLLSEVRAVLALGRLAHATYLKLLGLRQAAYPFAHGALHHPAAGPPLLDSYHPSRQNTNTGVLTRTMWLGALGTALELAAVRRDAGVGGGTAPHAGNTLG